MTILVIDLGSSAARAQLYDDRSADRIDNAVAVRRHEFESSHAGASTITMELIKQNVEACIDEVLTHPKAKAIRCAAMATFAGNLVGSNNQGEPVTPVYTYADAQSAEDVRQLHREVDPLEAHERTGTPIHTAYFPSRLRWLRRTRPELYARVASWQDAASYLYQRWFGLSQAVMSYSAASWTGLLNRRTLGWDHTWLQLLEVAPDKLPYLEDYNFMLKGLCAKYAARWPTLKDVPFCLAVGDGAAANVGSGCTDPTRIALTIGTTAALRIVTEQQAEKLPAALWDYRLTRAHHLTGGATSEGGNIYEWLQETLAIRPEDIERRLRAVRPDSHGLTVLPLFAGERSPGWALDATGAINGLRVSTSAADIAQAALEAVALRLSLIAEQLNTLASQGAVVIGSGGALTASPGWAQMMADALNRPLCLLEDRELTSRGAAIMAICALTQRLLSDFPLKISRKHFPNPEHVTIFRAASERQAALYEKLVNRP